MRYLLGFIIGCILWPLHAQTNTSESEAQKTPDLAYKEDQFYLGVYYNLLTQMPKDMSQNGFSSGFYLGKMFDIPLNADRNRGIGIGLGYSANSINQNLFISKDANGATNYEVISSSDFTKNKIAFHTIELPLEFRWRTSTPETYKFWRIYPGIKFSYVIASNSKFQGNGQNIKVKGLDDLRKFQYGVTLSAGYDTWNIQVYYGLQSLFDTVSTTTGEPIDTHLMRLGLIFYVL